MDLKASARVLPVAVSVAVAAGISVSPVFALGEENAFDQGNCAAAEDATQDEEVAVVKPEEFEEGSSSAFDQFPVEGRPLDDLSGAADLGVSVEAGDDAGSDVGEAPGDVATGEKGTESASDELVYNDSCAEGESGGSGVPDVEPEDASNVSAGSESPSASDSATTLTSNDELKSYELESQIPSEPEATLPDGWNYIDGQYFWVENGQVVKDKAFFAPETDGSTGNQYWYWADSDGAIARNKDVWIGSQSKWVRFDEHAHMIKGEDFRYGGWYLFDEITGAMLKGFRYILSNGGKTVYYDDINGQMAHGESYVGNNEERSGWFMFDVCTGAMYTGMTFVPSNGGKWVYYDIDNGSMAHGERFLSYDSEHNGWYLFDNITGAVQYGFQLLSDVQKWVYYDSVTAIMVHGESFVGDGWCLFDDVDGSLQYGWKYLAAGQKWVHYDGVTGRMQYGEQELGGVKYTFDWVTGALLNVPAGFDPCRISALDRGDLQLGILIKSGQVRSVRIIGDSILAGIGCQDQFSTNDNVILATGDSTFYEPSAYLHSASNMLRSDLEGLGVSLVNASIPQIGCMKFYSEYGEMAQGDEDLVVVMVGANDRGSYDKSETLGDFEAYSEQFISALVENYGSDRVVVCSSTPTLIEQDNFSIEQEDAVLRNLCAAKGWNFVSIYSNFSKVADAEGFDLSQLLLSSDGLHPNRRGQQVLYKTLSESLNL